MSAPDVIHIACQADARLAPDCAVMLHSLFSANKGESFEIHFLHDGGNTPAELADLNEIAQRFGQRFTALRVPEASLAGFPRVPHYGGHAAWFRLFLHELLRLPRVLYLDADLLVVDRVRPLWETDLQGRCVGAVSNSLFAHMVARVQRTLGVPDALSYFNSGVLLLELDRLRSSGLGEELLALVRGGATPLPWPDQDTLNAVLWRHRLPLHPRWNATPSIWELPWRYLAHSREQLREAREHPAIVHFVGPYKPLHYRNHHPYRARWFEHLAQTAWKDSPVVGRSLRNALLRPLPVLLQWRIEDGTLSARGLVRTLLPEQALARALVRDTWRWLTPRRPRNAIPVMLDALARSRSGVRFVQVGSNDATHDDPLRPFVLGHGWAGVLVEPVPYVFERLQRNCRYRPNLVLENVAIAPRDGTADFYCLRRSDDPLPHWYDQLGSFRLDNILKHEPYIPGLRERIVTLKVPCLSFESLCRKHRIGALDLVHIDAEGYDFEVIKLIDFDAHRPALLLFEHKHLGLAELRACHEHLHARGYELLADGGDTLALRRDELRRPWSALARAWSVARRAHAHAAPSEPAQQLMPPSAG